MLSEKVIDAMDETAQQVEGQGHSQHAYGDNQQRGEVKREDYDQLSISLLPQFPAILSNKAPSGLAMVPVLAVQGDELDTSGNSRRTRSHTTILPKVSLTSEAVASARSSLAANLSTPRGSIYLRSGAPEPLHRAVSMVQTYPIMHVEGTAFENQIHGRSSEIMDSSMTARSTNSLVISEGEDVGEKSADLAVTLERVRRTESVAQHAARLKRGYMWEVIITNFLICQVWEQLYRRRRLRAVLETRLLPILLRKRGVKCTISGAWRKSRCQAPVLLRENEGQKAQGSFLIGCSPFFAAFHNPKFCDILAEAVARYRFPAGDVIVNAGSPSQNALYILFSGKCDAILPSNEVGKLMQRSRVELGGVFGGIFGGKSVFTQTFKAVSQCIVWVLAREDFELLVAQHADENVKKVYLDAFKKYQIERLQQYYPLPQFIFRVPIYRRIERAAKEYVQDFTPLVLVNGDVIFNQGDPPGVVYCLVEGNVRREQLGPDMTYETGTQQILSPNNADHKFSLNTRFLLLGEEPHILPGPLRYRCTVVSRSALFYKIEGERFVSVLLDDAALFLQLRERLTTQIRLSMKLSPEALGTVPILVGLPFSNLNAIAHAAEARVVQRCVSICEPAQSIREIYILTHGDVRDPRNFDHTPTVPAVLPPSETEDSQDNQVKKGKKERPFKSDPISSEKDGKFLNLASIADQMASGRNQSVAAAGRTAEASPGLNSAQNGWAFFSSVVSDTGKNVTYPDEQEELAPPLPPNPTKKFLCTLGGGWEGLLLEKWPHGWETTTTVELWALPMLTVRTEFNSAPKVIQSTIICSARELQMRELGLPSPIITKLPRLSVYFPPEKRLTKHSLGVEKGVLLERKVAHRQKRSYEGGASREVSTVTGSRYGRAPGDLSTSRLSTLSGLFFASPMEKHKTNEARALRMLSPHFTSSVKVPLKQRARHAKKQSHTQQVTNAASPVSNVSAETIEVRKPKAGPPPLLFLRKLTLKDDDEQPSITPELCAIYAGKEPQKGIIRQPPSLPHHQRQQLFPPSPSELQNREVGNKTNRRVCGNQQSSWPVTAGVKKQWFHVVPDFAPLPGTVNNQSCISHIPNLVPNSAMMVRIEKGRGEMLAAEANYFTSLAQMRRRKENNVASPPSPVANTPTAEAKTRGRGGIVESAPTSTCTTSPMMKRPVPGRHVLLL